MEVIPVIAGTLETVCKDFEKRQKELENRDYPDYGPTKIS